MLKKLLTPKYYCLKLQVSIQYHQSKTYIKLITFMPTWNDDSISKLATYTNIAVNLGFLHTFVYLVNSYFFNTKKTK